MKLPRFVLPLLAATLACAQPGVATAAAESKHEHSHAHKVAGPNGGRVLTKVEPHAEFFVTAERKVQITFVDDDGKVVAPGTQVVSVITGERSAPTTLTFAKSGNALVSTAALPAGNGLPTVVQIKSAPEAKAVTEKFNLDLSQCGECKKPEYACDCQH